MREMQAMADNLAANSEAVDILVVDDNADNLQRLTEILCGEGYGVRQAGGPEAAIETALAHSPSLILLAAGMPGKGSSEVCRWLKQDERTCDIPVIFVSAAENEQYRVQGFEVGGKDSASTIFQAPELLDWVKPHLKLRRMQLHLEELVTERTAELRAKNEAVQKSRDALAESEEKHRFQTHLLDAVEQAVIVTDLEGHVVYWNPFAERLYGWSADEAMGRTTVDLIAPEQSRQHVAEIMARLQSGKSWSGEYTTHSRDGRSFPIQVTLTPIYDTGGDLYRIIGISSDISQRAHVEAALRQSEEQYRALVEQAQDGIILIQDGEIRFANSYIAGLVGHAVGEMEGTSFGAYLTADERPGVVDRYRRRLAGEPVPSVYELTIQHRDGSPIEVEVNAKLTTYRGKPAHLVFLRDIRERVRTRQRLEESRRLLDLVIDHVPALVSYVGSDLHYRFVNEHYEQAFVIPRSHLVGKHVQEILGPEDYADVKAKIAAALAGETVSYEEAFDYPGIGRRWMHVEYVPDRDPAGEAVQGFVAMSRDITESRKTEQALRESEAHLRRAQEVAQMGSWKLDIIQGELLWSDETYRIFGLSGEPPMDYETFLNCVVPEDRDRVNAKWQAALTGALYDIEHRISVGDGVKWVREKAEVEFDEAGRAIRGIGIVVDITERKIVEQQVLEYQRRLQALASQLTLSEERERRRIAHELHDEVGQRLTFARMALASARETTSEARRAVVLDGASESIRRSIGDIRDLVFDLSSPLLNQVGLAPALEEWLEEQVSKKHGIQAELIHDGRRLPLDDDVRTILFRSVRELLTNVVKHARAKSVIVRLEEEGTFSRIVVEDDGIGFDVDALPRETERGRGFGLFSIEERMAALGGSLEIISGPGRGCRAILTAPATIE
jgi:PAS domain S-box-containing protein